MRDFAHLFSDSASAWLRGRGDARFPRYERYYRADRASTQESSDFDLERTNQHYAEQSVLSRNPLGRIFASDRFENLMRFLVLLYGGSLLLPLVGKSYPGSIGVFLVVGFVATRLAARKTRKSRR